MNVFFIVFGSVIVLARINIGNINDYRRLLHKVLGFGPIHEHIIYSCLIELSQEMLGSFNVNDNTFYNK